MKYKINPPYNNDLLNQINNLSDGSTIEFKNTKGLTSSWIKRVKPTIKVRIIGGLDEKAKPKYNAPHYYDRTIYTTKQVEKILEIFELIESKIDPNWNELDKAMFVYKSLVENMEYDYDYKLEYNDHNRNLCGVLYKLSVCAGFSMIYKEMMDRLEIECLYQNQQHSHAWNVLKINGTYYPVDLTWDVNCKTNGKCNFKYFGADPNFFKDQYHQGTNELIVPSNTFSKDEFNRSYEKVVDNKIKKLESKEIVNKNGKKIAYYVLQRKDFKQLFLFIDGKMKVIAYDEDKNLDFFLNYDFSKTKDEKFASSKNKDVSNKMKKLLSNARIITRSDSSQLYIENKFKKIEDVNVFGIIKYSEQQKKFAVSNILSEEELSKKNEDIKRDQFIADVLLSNDRVGEKIDRFGGYVGYVREIYGRYQKVINSQFEEKISGISRF